MSAPMTDIAILNRMCLGGWWASYRLAIECGKMPRPVMSLALRRLKRRGMVETSGQSWRATDAGRAAS